METPAGKVALQLLLKEALAKNYPGVETAVEYQGVTEHDPTWHITVAGVSRNLTQRETTVLLRGHGEEFIKHFGTFDLKTEKDHGEGKI